MMALDIQIKSFLISILFGILFSYVMDMLYKDKIFNIIISFFVILLFSFVYFITLLKINNAIIHPYYIFAFIIGYCLQNILKKYLKKIVLFKKKWYNFLGG